MGKIVKFKNEISFELENPLTGELIEYSGKPNDVWAACEIIIKQLQGVKKEAIEDAKLKAVTAKQENPLLPNTFRVETLFGDIKIELRQEMDLGKEALEEMYRTAPNLVTEKIYYKLKAREAKKEMSKLNSPLGQKLKEVYEQTSITAKITLEGK